jgi:hypothetical protein
MALSNQLHSADYSSRNLWERIGDLIWPPGLLAAASLAAYLCLYDLPLSHLPVAIWIILSFSVLPLLALGILTALIYFRDRRLRGELETEQDVANSLVGQEEEIQEEMRAHRKMAKKPAGALSYTGKWLASASGNGSGLVSASRSYVELRCSAGEDLRLDSLRNFMSEYVVKRVEGLQTYHERAFQIGLLGTVAGFIVQIIITQELMQGSFFSQSFLTGVILKAGSTGVGIMVAIYARSRRERLLEQYDRLAQWFEEFAGRHLAIVFTEASAERGDLADRLQATINEFKRTVAGIDTKLKSAISEAVKDLSGKLGESLKVTLASQLADIITNRITAPFCDEMGKLRMTLSQTQGAMLASARELNDNAVKIKNELASTIKSSSDINEGLSQTKNQVGNLIDKFEKIVKQADSVAHTLHGGQGELALAIKQIRNQDGHHNSLSLVTKDLINEAEIQRGEAQNLGQQLAVVAQMMDDLTGVARTIDGLNQGLLRNNHTEGDDR